MHAPRPKTVALLAVLAVAGVVATMIDPATTPASPALNPSTINATSNWPTYHRSNDRTGYLPGLPVPRTLNAYWAPPTAGQVYAQPLVVGGLVIVATEQNFVYALSLATKRLAWRTYLGPAASSASLPCGNISPFSGITGTPVYDQSTGSLFLVTESGRATHTIWALSATTGRPLWHRPTDIALRDPLAQQQRGALAVANGRVYVPFGGRYGDCGNYAGYVSSFPTTGIGPRLTYQVPTTRGGGIWAPPGPSLATDGSLFVSVGNGTSTNPTHWDGSDSVLHLSPALRLLSFFRPLNWAAENANDLDLGSSGPMLLPGNRVLISGKAGDIYLLNIANLRVPLAHLSGCAAYGGDAYDPTLHAAFLPCDSGLQRVDIGTNSLTRRWQGPDTGTPVVAGGLVWYQTNGHLYARSEANKTLRFVKTIGATARFASIVVIPGYVIVGTKIGVTIFRIA